MSFIVTHKVNGVNDGIDIEVVDKPGPGGAHHKYRVTWDEECPGVPGKTHQEYRINFQNGPIKEAGVNGLTHEVLLAIIIDRLTGFQSGPYACADNQEALDAAQKAQEALMRRTRARAARGVEGTMKV